ncbi:hypothetical protein H9P43_003798 [Blastocladiella emersonii ATCC 22665]|nr:hypothetical protein H9P43_003787 [Blastocladiella emersonii ATCC 22665]KAI9182887.1 hypothetical protein H9P43_003798 [Blastocladiella emersonii ATCC 22665]
MTLPTLPVAAAAAATDADERGRLGQLLGMTLLALFFGLVALRLLWALPSLIGLIMAIPALPAIVFAFCAALNYATAFIAAAWNHFSCTGRPVDVPASLKDQWLDYCHDLSKLRRLLVAAPDPQRAILMACDDSLNRTSRSPAQLRAHIREQILSTMPPMSAARVEFLVKDMYITLIGTPEDYFHFDGPEPASPAASTAATTANTNPPPSTPRSQPAPVASAAQSLVRAAPVPTTTLPAIAMRAVSLLPVTTTTATARAAPPVVSRASEQAALPSALASAIAPAVAPKHIPAPLLRADSAVAVETTSSTRMSAVVQPAEYVETREPVQLPNFVSPAESCEPVVAAPASPAMIPEVVYRGTVSAAEPSGPAAEPSEPAVAAPAPPAVIPEVVYAPAAQHDVAAVAWTPSTAVVLESVPTQTVTVHRESAPVLLDARPVPASAGLAITPATSRTCVVATVEQRRAAHDAAVTTSSLSFVLTTGPRSAGTNERPRNRPTDVVTRKTSSAVVDRSTAFDDCRPTPAEPAAPTAAAAWVAPVLLKNNYAPKEKHQRQHPAASHVPRVMQRRFDAHLAAFLSVPVDAANPGALDAHVMFAAPRPKVPLTHMLAARHAAKARKAEKAALSIIIRERFPRGQTLELMQSPLGSSAADRARLAKLPEFRREVLASAAHRVPAAQLVCLAARRDVGRLERRRHRRAARKAQRQQRRQAVRSMPAILARFTPSNPTTGGHYQFTSVGKHMTSDLHLRVATRAGVQHAPVSKSDANKRIVLGKLRLINSAAAAAAVRNLGRCC